MEKGGLTAQLEAAGCTDRQGSFWSDEMRVGLIGAVRRVWTSIGVKVVQPLEYTHEWVYLNLAVNGLTGVLRWDWTPNMKSVALAPIVQAWSEAGVKTLMWDQARGHRGPAYDDSPVQRIEQPPYSPELNPAERIFECLRDRIEGFVYSTIANKKAAVERELHLLADNPDLVKRLAGWQWIHDSFSALP